MLESIVDKDCDTNMFSLTLKREDKLYKGMLGITNVNYAMLEEEKSRILDDDEIRLHQSLLNDHIKESFLRSRFICKMSVGNFLNSDEFKTIKIRHGVFEQPLLDSTNGISVSHSGDFAACVVFPDEHPMGLDLEVIQEDAVMKIDSQLTKNEMILADQLEEEKYRSYTRCWTVKEALSKVLKTGLMVPFHMLEINSLKPDKKYTLSYFKNFIQYKAISCTLQDVMVSVVLPAETEFKIEKINIVTNKFI